MHLIDVRCSDCGAQPAFWYNVGEHQYNLRCKTCAVTCNSAAKLKGESYPYTPLIKDFFYYADGVKTRHVKRMVPASPSEWMVFYTEAGDDKEKFCSAGIFHTWIVKNGACI